jgi:hypothetical protein
MAITRAQQVRQMYKEGSMEPVKQAGVMNYMPSEMVTVPKIAKSSPDTPTAKLAYITPEEQDILIDLNLYGSLDGKPNRGPGGIPSLEGDFGGGDTYSGGGADFGGAGGDFSGAKDTGTGNYVSNNPNVSIDEQRKVNAAIDRELKQAAEDKAIKAAEDLQAQKVMERRKKMGAKLIREKIPGTQEYIDAEKDDTAAELDLFINDPYREDGTKRTFFPTPMGIGLNLLKEPLKAGAKKTREFFTGPTTDIFGRNQKGVLAAGRFNYKGEPLTEERFANMSLTEKNQAYKDYMSQRLGNEIDAYGNPLNTGDDRGGESDQPIIPIIPDPVDPGEGDDNNTTQNPIAYRFMADGGIMNADIVGGMMDGNMDEMGRQMYGLGKLVKKATRAIKKVAKSPLGKAALLYGLGAVGGSVGAGKGLFSKGMFNLANMKAGLFGQAMKPGFAGPGIPGLFNKLGLTKTAGSLMPTFTGGLALASLAPLVFQGQEDEENFDPYRGPDIDIDKIRSDPYAAMGGAYRFAADGGLMRMGYQEGGDAEPVAKKTMPLIDMDGKEKDYRETGGFVDMGRMERADDVPARLSKNEFVFTADAVRNAGEGDIDKGAEVMYNMMKNLEAGGEVSEESQGLEGARNMFQTSQRLGEVI